MHFIRSAFCLLFQQKIQRHNRCIIPFCASFKEGVQIDRFRREENVADLSSGIKLPETILHTGLPQDKAKGGRIFSLFHFFPVKLGIFIAGQAFHRQSAEELTRIICHKGLGHDDQVKFVGIGSQFSAVQLSGGIIRSDLDLLDFLVSQGGQLLFQRCTTRR